MDAVLSLAAGSTGLQQQDVFKHFLNYARIFCSRRTSGNTLKKTRTL
jgi:hypothetical protein